MQKLSYFLISTQICSQLRNQALLEERVHFINFVRQHASFKAVLAQVFKIMKEGLQCFTSNEKESQRKILEEKCKGVFNAIEIMSHLVDLEGLELDAGIAQIKKDYFYTFESRKPDQIAEEDQQKNLRMLRIYRMKKELQCRISDMGFFPVFFEFVSGLGNESMDETAENDSQTLEHMQFRRQKLGKKLFRKLLILSIKLIRGDDSVNVKVQNQIYEQLRAQKQNFFFRKIYFLLCKEKLDYSKKINDIKIILKDDLKRIQFSYNFNDDHILSQKPCLSQKNLAYQISKRQTKFVLKNFHKDLFNKIKNLPKHLRFYQKDMPEQEEFYSDYLYSEEEIFYILKFLQILVEDHHSKLQNYLRQQPDFQTQYDIVSKMIDLLEVYCNESLQISQIVLSASSQMKILMCFDALKEMVQGPCVKNQNLVCSNQFLNLVNHILRIDDSHASFLKLYQDTVEQYFREKKTITQTLTLMIGKNDQNSFDGFDSLGHKKSNATIHQLWSSA